MTTDDDGPMLEELFTDGGVSEDGVVWDGFVDLEHAILNEFNPDQDRDDHGRWVKQELGSEWTERSKELDGMSKRQLAGEVARYTQARGGTHTVSDYMILSHEELRHLVDLVEKNDHIHSVFSANAESFFSTCERDEHGWCTPGGGAGRTMTDDKILEMVLHQTLVGDVVSSFSEDGKFKDEVIEKMSVQDRVALMQLHGKIYHDPAHQVFFDPRRYRYSTPEEKAVQKSWDAFRDEAKNGKWSGEKILEEGLSRGLLSRKQFEGGNDSYRIGNSRVFSGAQILKGLDEGQRKELVEGYVNLKGKTGVGFDAIELRKAGWSTKEVEGFADALQEKGFSAARWHAEKSEYDQRDAMAQSLAFYSKDYDNFRSGLYSDWSIISNSQGAVSAREIANDIWKHEGGEFHRPTGHGREEGLYSPRAVENLKRMKAETEAYYKKKLKTDDLKSKPLELTRGIGGNVSSYSPSSVESWTTDERTVARFGKLMEQDGKWAALRTTVTYDDVLWSYQTAKGAPGWPAEKDLKGKKEFVTLGRGISSVDVDNHSESRKGRY